MALLRPLKNPINGGKKLRNRLCPDIMAIQYHPNTLKALIVGYELMNKTQVTYVRIWDRVWSNGNGFVPKNVQKFGTHRWLRNKKQNHYNNYNNSSNNNNNNITTKDDSDELHELSLNCSWTLTSHRYWIRGKSMLRTHSPSRYIKPARFGTLCFDALDFV